MNFEKIRYYFRKWGFIKGFYFCLMAAVSPWLTFCHVYLRPQYPKPKTFDLIEGVEIRPVSADELVSQCSDSVLELDETMIKSAYARGDTCVAAILNGNIVAYVWHALNDTPHEDGLWVTIKDGYRYEYKAFTKPNYRKQHLQSSVSYFADKKFYNSGVRTGIVFIESHNYASIISDKSRGGKKVGYVGYFKLFGRVYPFRSPGSKKHGFKFYPPESSPFALASN